MIVIGRINLPHNANWAADYRCPVRLISDYYW